MIKVKCFCGEEFEFCDDYVSNEEVYETECPACHTFLKRKKVSSSASKPNRKIYNKLVRDKIPEIIKANGDSCKTEIINDDIAYLTALQRKLDEEIAEYHNDDTIEELADIVEVVYALVKAHGISKEHFDSFREDKAREKGGFEKRVYLISTENK